MALRYVAPAIACVGTGPLPRYARDVALRAGLSASSPAERLVGARKAFNHDFNGQSDRLRLQSARLVQLALDAPPEIAQGIRSEATRVSHAQLRLQRIGAAARALRGDVPHPMVAERAYMRLREAMTVDAERHGVIMREVAELVREATRAS